MLIDWIFLGSLIACFIIGIFIFKFTFKSLQELVKSDESIPEDAVGKTGFKVFIFGISFSLAVNIFGYIIYGLITNQWVPFTLQVLVYSGFLVIVFVSFREVFEFSKAEEEQAVFPNHKLYELLGTSIYKKVSSRGITAFIMSLIFYFIPFIVLISLNFSLFNSLLFSFYYIPILMIGYFYALGLYKTIRPYLYFKSGFNPRIILFGILIILMGFNIYSFFNGYYEYFPYLFLVVQVGISSVIIISLIKGSKHRPLSLIHLFKERMRPFEYLYIGQILLETAFLFMFTVILLRPELTNFRYIFKNSLIIFSDLDLNILTLFEIIFFIASFAFVFFTIYNRHRVFDVGVKNYLINNVEHKNIPLKYKFLNDQTIIETIDDLAELKIIEPRFLVNLIHCLKHKDVSLRRKAVNTLRKIMELDKDKIPLVVPYFMRMLKSDKVWTVRLEIAESLSKIINRIPNEIPVILDYLKKESHDTNRYVRWGVLRVYESILKAELERADQLLPYIFDAFNDKEWSVKKGALDVLINLSKISPKIIPKILPTCMDLLKTAQDEDLLNTLYQFIEFCTGLEVTIDNYKDIVNELNSIVKCVDEECQNQLYNNLKTIEEMKERKRREIELKREEVEKFKDERYKLSFD
ncbi:MAG: sister chromatid cohesion protein PDS5 [Candidatus Helarchaeota archaeon]